MPSPSVQAGKLDKRVKIIQPVFTQDSFGGTVDGSALIKEVWASVDPLSGRELYAAQQMNSQVTHKVRIRWRVGIKSDHLVWFGERTFQVQAVVNPEEGRQVLELMCIERADSAREGRGDIVLPPGPPTIPSQEPVYITADGTTNVFTLAVAPTGGILLWWNGLFQTPPGDYTLSGAVITMALTPYDGDKIAVVYL